jgi:CheY-like chemotaxis protein
MSPPIRVALFGFGVFEERALASFLRLASDCVGTFEPVRELAAAEYIVADADAHGVVDRIVAAARISDTVFIGASSPEAAAVHLSRPIDLLQLQRELDALAASRRAVTRAQGARAAAPAPDVAATRSPRAGFVALDAVAPPPAAVLVAPPDASALIVDDSAIAQRYLQVRLQRLGLAATLADSSARALELLARRSFAFVFLDVELGEDSALDGLALCQHIRRQHRHVDGRIPVIVMVSAHHSQLDRARGAFAGCDHYLAKPIDDDALRQVFAQHRPEPAARATGRSRGEPPSG